MVYFIVCLDVESRFVICFEGHRVISVLGLLLSVLPSLNKAYYLSGVILLLARDLHGPSTVNDLIDARPL